MRRGRQTPLLVFLGRRPLPPPRPIRWELRPLDSARTTMFSLPDGRLELTIAHAPLDGVTPEMLRWWFEHLDEKMEYEGLLIPRYLAWHPLDHVAFEMRRRAPNGRGGPGARFRIVEAFARDEAHRIDTVDDVDKLDDEGITLVRRLPGGNAVFQLEHRFEPAPSATRYRSRMLVGTSSRPLRPLINGLLRPRLFSDATAAAWLRHNVEEVGNLVPLLPPLYAAARSRD